MRALIRSGGRMHIRTVPETDDTNVHTHFHRESEGREINELETRVQHKDVPVCSTLQLLNNVMNRY